VKVLRTALGEGSGAPGTLLDAAGTVACGEGALRLVQVQPAGKPAMGADAFLRGRRLGPGARLA
jgi:methionyl-tRNA formyltransferase